MTVCDRGKGGSKIIKKSVTYFMDGPLGRHVESEILHDCRIFVLNSNATTSNAHNKICRILRPGPRPRLGYDPGLGHPSGMYRSWDIDNSVIISFVRELWGLNDRGFIISIIKLTNYSLCINNKTVVNPGIFRGGRQWVGHIIRIPTLRMGLRRGSVSKKGAMGAHLWQDPHWFDALMWF